MSLKIIGKVSSKMGYSKTKTFKKWINTFQKPEREKKKQNCFVIRTEQKIY